MSEDDGRPRGLLPALLQRHKHRSRDILKVAVLMIVVVFVVWVLLG